MWPRRREPNRLLRPWDSPGKNTGVGCHFLLQCMKVKSESEVAQSCLTLFNLMDCSLPGSSVHGIFQARVLEWGAIAFWVLFYEDHHKHLSAFLSPAGAYTNLDNIPPKYISPEDSLGASLSFFLFLPLLPFLLLWYHVSLCTKLPCRAGELYIEIHRASVEPSNNEICYSHFK